MDCRPTDLTPTQDYRDQYLMPTLFLKSDRDTGIAGGRPHLLWTGESAAGDEMPTAHLVFGFLGSGKTTLAKRLERQHNAVRFTPDDWMARLFGEDPPAKTFQDRAAAILDIMQPVWVRCLSLGLDVVLDYGFWSRAERDRVRAAVEDVGATPVLWAVSCSDDEARKRIALRNQAAHRSLSIAPETFDLLKVRVEPLDMDEPYLEA